VAEEQQPITRDDVAGEKYSSRLTRYVGGAPYLVSRFGRIENPDPIMQQLRMGTWYSLVFIRQMLLDEAILGGIIDQWVSAVNATDITFEAGDSNSEISKQMALDATRFWNDVPDTPLILAKQLYCRAFGYYPIDKVYGQHEATGLLGAVGLYDMPPWHVDFDIDGNEIYAPFGGGVLAGVRIPTGKLMIARWGSNYTPRGESDAVPLFPNVWRMKTVRKLGLQALEILNRPIPWVKYPEGWDEAQVDELEADMIAKYKFAVLTPSAEATDVEVDFPMNAVAASGAAGRSELEVVASEVRTIYIKWLGAPQSQNEQNGSMAKEVVRKEIADDKTPPAVQLRDKWIQKGWLDDLGYLNWPNQPRQLWPICRSDSGDQSGIDGNTAEQVWRVLARLALQQITRVAATESLVLMGVRRAKALLMVQSTVDESGQLQVTAQSVASGVSQTPQAAAAA
jgi:hypothetical protein